MDTHDVLNEQFQAERSGREYATVTILSAEGSTPRSSGKLLVYADGAVCGTIGGGTAELAATRDALECLRLRENAVKTYDLAEANEALGMICGGNMQVFIEVFVRRPCLIMCGGGHVGAALLRLAGITGFSTILLDDRPKEAIPESVALAERFVSAPDFCAALGELDIPKGAFIVIATHGHLKDGEALRAALKKDAAYIGMIGSRLKTNRLFEALRSEGVSDSALERVYAPIGLAIASESPAEIAVSIMGELLLVKNGGSAAHMRNVK